MIAVEDLSAESMVLPISTNMHDDMLTVNVLQLLQVVGAAINDTVDGLFGFFMGLRECGRCHQPLVQALNDEEGVACMCSHALTLFGAAHHAVSCTVSTNTHDSGL